MWIVIQFRIWCIREKVKKKGKNELFGFKFF
jgi:hypothetical protein